VVAPAAAGTEMLTVTVHFRAEVEAEPQLLVMAAELEIIDIEIFQQTEH
jgi:hypothetical protein